METAKTDLSNLSLEEIQAELNRRQNEKNNDRETYKKLVEETVPKAILRLCTASEMLTNAKTETYKFFEQILDLKQQTYNVKEKQRSHTFTCETGEITIGYRINDGWDDTVNVGITKVNNFIGSLAKDESTAKLVNVVLTLLKKDAKGNLKSNRVLELQKMTKEFNSEEFADGVDIISKAFKPVRSSWYIEASIIKDNGEKVTIPLNISSVDFAAGYSFSFFNNPKIDNHAST